MHRFTLTDARSLYREGLRLRAENELVRAADLLARAALAAQSELGSAEAAEINLALGITLVDLKRFDTAVDLLPEVVAALEHTARWGDALNTLGNALYGRLQFPVAMERYDQAAAAYRETGQPDDKMSLPTRNRAMCLSRLGQPEAASGLLRDLLGRALGPAEREAVSYQLAAAYDEQGAPALAQEIFEALLPTASQHCRPQILNSLAICHDNQGRNDAALQAYAQAAKEAGTLGDRRRGYANILFSYASHAAYLGEIGLAKTVVRRAARWIGRHPDARERRSLGEIRFHLASAAKQPGTALTLLRQLEADALATLAADSPALLRTRILLADTLRRTDPAAAHAVLAEALRAFGPTRADPQTGFARCVLAEILLGIGDARQAKAAALAALTATIDSGNADLVWYVLHVLAASLRANGQLQSAVVAGKLAAELVRRLQLLVGQPFRTSRFNDERVGHVWRALEDLLAYDHRPSEADAVHFCFRREGLLDAARRDAADAAFSVPVPMTTAEADALTALEAILAARRVEVARAVSGEADPAAQARATKRHRGAVARWTRRLPSIRPGATPPLPEIGLGPEIDLALSYLVLPDRLIVTVSDADGVTRTELPVTAEALGLQCHRYRRAVSEGAAAADQLGAALFETILAPVWPAVRRARHVRIAADGALRFIPFCALVTDEGYVLETVSLSYWAGAPPRAPSSAPRAAWRVLGAGLSALAQAGPELSGLPHGGGRAILLGTGFTGDALADALSAGAEIVHLASHFDLDAVQAGRSRLQLGDGSALTLDMLRHRERFDFSGVELLYLSGCNTGTAGQNAHVVESLAGVFHLRGVRNVVATLWPVLDTDAQAVAAGFYAGFAVDNSGSLAERLRVAQLARLHDAPPPRPKLSERRGGFEIVAADASHPRHWASHVIYTC